MKMANRATLLSVVGAAFLLLLIGVPQLYSAQVTLPPEIVGVVPPGGEAMACSGFNSKRDRWGVEYGYCPRNHAFFGVDDPAGAKGPPKKIRAVHTCCQLPSDDILLQQHVFVQEECPEEYVATGSKRLGEGEATRHLLRCTRVNTDRYKLSTELPSVYWGNGGAGWQEGAVRISRDTIPASLRYSVGRKAIDDWDVDGCVGYPWGSLLSKKSSKYCSGMYFKQLQFVGVPGDPPAGTAVKMLPDCREIANVSDPLNFGCSG